MRLTKFARGILLCTVPLWGGWNMLLGGGLVDALYPHILQNQANGGGGAEDAGLGQAVSPGEGEVLAGHGDGAFRQGGDVGGAGQARMVMCSRVRSRRGRALWFQSPP